MFEVKYKSRVSRQIKGPEGKPAYRPECIGVWSEQTTYFSDGREIAPEIEKWNRVVPHEYLLVSALRIHPDSVPYGRFIHCAHAEGGGHHNWKKKPICR